MVDFFVIPPTAWGDAWWAHWSAQLDDHLLEKGRRHAAQGGVTEWTITGEGVVQACVQVVGGKTYHLQAQAPPLSAEEQAAWLTRLQATPQWVAQLLNHQIPNAWLAPSFELPLLLPAIDWQLACSCGRRSQPCYHMVAMAQALRQHIDQAPLGLFQLRGMPLLELLQRMGAISHSSQALTLDDWGAKAASRRPAVPALLATLDFAPINNGWAPLELLLQAEPPFFQGNLMAALQRDWRKAQRWQAQQVYKAETYTHWHRQLRQTKDLALVMDRQHQLVNVFVIEGENSTPLFASDRVMATLTGVMATVERAYLNQYPIAFQGLHTLYRLALKLLEEHAMVPQLMTTTEGVVVQWGPADALQPEVRRVVTLLAKACPDDLLLLDAPPLKRLQRVRQIQLLVGVWLHYFLRQATERSVIFQHPTDKIRYLFSSGQPVAFQGPHEQAIPQQIQHWLQPLSLGQEQFAPVLKVEEQKEEDTPWTFTICVQVEDRANPKAALLDLFQFLEDPKRKTEQLGVLQVLQRLEQYYPALGTILAQQKAQMPPYTPAAFETVFFDVLPILQLLGIAVLLPQSLQRLTKPRLGIHIVAKEGTSPKGKSFMNLKALLQVEWKVAVGEELVEAVELLKWMKQKKRLVRHKDRYLYLNEADLQRILEQLDAPPPATAHQLVHAALSKVHEEYPVTIAPEVEPLLAVLQDAPVVVPPQTLKATLRAYQQVGYAWMYKNAQLGLGALIADDMGLGKTLQVIALLLKFKEEGHLDQQQVLVVVPTSLLTNWKQELAKFAPLLQVGIYHGARRQLPYEVDVIITTYGVARMEVETFSALELYVLVIDEAQAIKNSHAAQTDAIKSIQARLKIAMSGTPVENRLTEYWSIMDFVYPDYLGTMADFKARYSTPIERDNDQAALDVFRRITAPFILRRLKSDASIIQDLPDKIEQDWIADLQPLQRELYQKIVDDSLHTLRQKSDKKTRQTVLLQLMGTLKQVCNHPYQYLGSGGSGPVYSGKSQVLMDLLTRIEHQGEKVLIFTQYRKMGRLLEQWIEDRFGQVPLYLHGGCTRTQRDAMVTAFQQDPQHRVFILSLKAAGTGLNLTAANHVIHYDLWWNPAVEAQATDRAYRIGQHKNVQVYRLMTAGTLEERINAMIQSKKDLADRTVVLGEQWLGNLSEAELEALVRL